MLRENGLHVLQENWVLKVILSKPMLNMWAKNRWSKSSNINFASLSKPNNWLVWFFSFEFWHKFNKVFEIQYRSGSTIEKFKCKIK